MLLRAYRAVKDNTKAVFGETLANPALAVLDIEKLARVAHKQYSTYHRQHISYANALQTLLNLVQTSLFTLLQNIWTVMYKSAALS